MSRAKSDIKRPYQPIGATIETLSFLFDVSQPMILKALRAGRIEVSTAVFGVKLYHVKSVERAVFSLTEAERRDEGPEPPRRVSSIDDAILEYAASERARNAHRKDPFIERLEAHSARDAAKKLEEDDIRKRSKSVPETAIALGLTQTKVYNLVLSKELACVKIGPRRLKRIMNETIEAYRRQDLSG